MKKILNLFKNVQQYQEHYNDSFIFILFIAIQNILQLDNIVKGIHYCIFVAALSIFFIFLTMKYIAQQCTEYIVAFSWHLYVCGHSTVVYCTYTAYLVLNVLLFSHHYSTKAPHSHIYLKHNQHRTNT